MEKTKPISMQTPDTPQLTPIEKAIEELEEMRMLPPRRDDYALGYKYTVEYLLSVIEPILSYERQYIRDVAEKAWEECRKSTIENASIEHDNVRDMEFVEVDYSALAKSKQTYLNQNHPL